MLCNEKNEIACFLDAIQAAARERGKKEVGERAIVHASVILGQPTDRPGYGLNVVLSIEGLEDQAILDAAHEVSQRSLCYNHRHGWLSCE